MKIIEVWINCPDAEVAEAISGRLIADRLVACSNLFPPIRSSYHWQGKVESEQEIPLLVKTRESLFDAVCQVVSGMHPYETPGIIAVPVRFVNDEYKKWVFAETSDPDSVCQ